MKQYDITGMSCAACSARVEKAVSAVPGVTSCAVNLLTNSMGVEGDATSQDIIKAVENAGYGAEEKGAGRSQGTDREDPLADKTTPLMIKRLVSSVVLLLVLMYFSMGVHMLRFPLPSFMKGDHVSMALVQMILAGLIAVINQKFFISGFKGLIHLAPNMDTLIALGATASFVYSTVMTFAMSSAAVRGGADAAALYMNELYFESAAMILTLVTVGKTLEAYSKGRTTDALRSLMKLAPVTANVIRDGVEQTVPIENVTVGDIFAVRPGENIPVDGVVIEGTSAVNESALTGESIPVDKEAGSTVSSATLNQSGYLKCRATRVGEDTTLSKIISMVSDAAATKAPVAKIADKISGVFVPAVICIAAVTIIIWLLLGKDAGYALARGISVLVVSCPCALGLATPVAIMVGNGVGARSGILFKTAEALQETGRATIAALDKTGTITSGVPAVTDVVAADGISEEELIGHAVSVESLSEHPLAKAVTQYAALRGISPSPVTGFSALPGNGLEAEINGEKITGGSLRFVGSKIGLPDIISEEAAKLSEEGKTPVVFSLGNRVLGVIAIADEIKSDSAKAIDELKNMGIRVVMITGDNERTARAVGAAAHVDEVIAEVLPDGKADAIEKLRRAGKVVMIGDGINDAPALTGADIGVAIGAGTDVAIDAADVVLMKSKLTDVAAAVRLSRQTYRNIKENLFWALIYNVLLIPLACGMYAKLGLTMNPMWGAAAMSCSSIFVVLNALRLNLYNVYDSSRDIKRAQVSATKEIEREEIKGDKTMTKTVNIEGMMCPHCEANVKGTLEAIDGIVSANVSHEANTAVIELSKDVDVSVIRDAITDKGYKFVSME